MSRGAAQLGVGVLARWGGASQFIDIQGFDPVTTGMPQRSQWPLLSPLCGVCVGGGGSQRTHTPVVMESTSGG